MCATMPATAGFPTAAKFPASPRKRRLPRRARRHRRPHRSRRLNASGTMATPSRPCSFSSNNPATRKLASSQNLCSLQHRAPLITASSPTTPISIRRLALQDFAASLGPLGTPENSSRPPIPPWRHNPPPLPRQISEANSRCLDLRAPHRPTGAIPSRPPRLAAAIHPVALPFRGAS